MMSNRIANRSPVEDLVRRHLNGARHQIAAFKAPAASGATAEELGVKAHLGLCDLSALPRVGIKGAGGAAWLSQQGVNPPERIYASELVNGLGWIVRTGASEFLIESRAEAERFEQLDAALRNAPVGVYRVERQDACFLLTGTMSLRLLREVCAYDFERSDERMVFARMAGVSCGILPQQDEDVPAFRIWVDFSLGEYLWETFYRLVREFGGDAIGAAALSECI